MQELGEGCRKPVQGVGFRQWTTAAPDLKVSRNKNNWYLTEKIKGVITLLIRECTWLKKWKVWLLF